MEKSQNDLETCKSNIERWRIRKLIKELEPVCGFNVISIIIPPTKTMSRVTEWLANHKSRMLSELQNHSELFKDARMARLDACTYAQEVLERCKQVPRNGLVLYSGMVIIRTKSGEFERIERVSISFEPFMPIDKKRFRFVADVCFHIQVLNDLVEYPDDRFGFIIMDDEHTLFGKLKGNRSHVIRKISVEGSGYYHVKKAEKLAAEFFKGQQVKGVVLNDLSDLRLRRWLRKKKLMEVEIDHANEEGLEQAINLSELKFYREKKLLDKYLKEIVDGPEKGTYGVEDTITALEERAAETLIVWDSLDIIRYVFKDINTGETVVKYSKKKLESKVGVQEEDTLLEWFAKEYKRFGCRIEFVSNESKEGELFCRVYGGIGAIIRCPNPLWLNLYAFNLAKRLRTRKASTDAQSFW